MPRVVFVCVVALVMSSCLTAADAEPHKISEEANRCLHIAEDATLPFKVRRDALRALAEMQEVATVDRLCKLLPKDNNGSEGVAMCVIAALGQIKSPKALPALVAVDENKDLDLHGKTRAVLRHAMRNCGGRVDD